MPAPCHYYFLYYQFIISNHFIDHLQDSASVSTVQWPVSMASEARQRPRSEYFGSAGTERDAEIDDLPSVVLSSNSFSAASKSSMVDFVEVSPASIGLYFEDGSYTVMSFTSKDMFVNWLQVLSAVVAVNRVRRSFPHIGRLNFNELTFSAPDYT
ncbi:unnamed protein product [Dibothriocephalus latus]|uniref:Uncharacterized protein n=1 Tax=Dibothriocephalus latus TaxID=60516 RepID=A0A3P7L9U3_DIBLA|nr:unnamed protein product [Dibothriocephalus latus]